MDALGDRLAVADFYRHRVAYLVDGRDRSFGAKGTGPGQFTYPTDVQFAHGRLWVADAYNHRVQAFTLDGAHVLTLGEGDGLNAATGLHVGADAVAVTDFENSRVLVYSLDGDLRQVITEGLDKPTDVLLHGDSPSAVNYARRSVSTYVRTPEYVRTP